MWWLMGCSLAVTGQNMMIHQVEHADFSSKRMEIGDGQYHYWDNGSEGDSRSVVVFLHGFGGDGLNTWSPIMRDLGKDHRVLVPDLLWFGDSWGGGTPRLEAQVEVAGKMLQRREWGRRRWWGFPTGDLWQWGCSPIRL